MTVLYSPSARGFFDRALHKTLPADVVEIDAARHAELLAGQAEGAEIAPCARTGRPQAQRRRLSVADRRAALLREIKREAARRIEAVAPLWRQLNDLREPGAAGSERFARIDMIRAASDAIERQLAGAAGKTLAGFPVRENPLWPEFD